jgi:hypothetical protein
MLRAHVIQTITLCGITVALLDPNTLASCRQDPQLQRLAPYHRYSRICYNQQTFATSEQIRLQRYPQSTPRRDDAEQAEVASSHVFPTLLSTFRHPQVLQLLAAAVAAGQSSSRCMWSAVHCGIGWSSSTSAGFSQAADYQGSHILLG